jgi:hypothetical protein
MQRRIWLAALAVAAIIAGATLYSQARNAKETPMPGAVAFRILLGVGDTAPVEWDGSVSVSPGKVANVQGWRFGPKDSISGSSWKASTRASGSNTGAPKVPGPVMENGVIVSVTDPSAKLEVKTAQGSFSFDARKVPYGVQLPFLGGKAAVDRVPDTLQLTDSPEDQDFAAIAQNGDSVYVSYVEFVHGDRKYETTEKSLDGAEPKSFDFLARPVGGDQIFLLQYSKSKRIWSAPIPVSAPKQDVMRTAVAVDGQKRVWVFWSANKGSNFDIYGRAYSGGRWSSEVRITDDPGTDLNPVAATDAKGRIWLAWQGFRNHNLEVLAAVQNGDSFSKASIVSFSKESDWDPAIAAAPNGEVAVSWDTYDKGDYDVYFRKLRFDGGIRMDAPVPVAASQNFEARSSVAYDPQDRLWVAYESSATKWGKDFGAYDTNGIALYQDHNLRVKCFAGGKPFITADDLVAKLPGAPQPPAGKGHLPTPPPGYKIPDPKIANKDTGKEAVPPSLPLNSFPRLAVDSSGMVYLAFRTPPTMMGGGIPKNTIWFSEIVYFDGAKWSQPAIIPNSDSWLDVRAAMVAAGPGDLMVVTTGDHRQSSQRPGPINADLFAAEFRPQEKEAAGSARLKAIAAETVAPLQKDVQPERDQVALMRNYRVTLGSDRVQIMRGEFHRHTEMSGDGGRDGPLVDAYRYMIDAAYMDWVGCCDHTNGGREYSWWLQQKMTDAYHLDTNFVPMFSYERSIPYPEGHRNVIFVQRGIRVLPSLPLSDPDKPSPAPDTQMLYRYLRHFDGIVASHTSGTTMGTDWRDNDPALEPLVEIYQGDRQNYEIPGGPRSLNVKADHKGWVSLALKKGYRLGFQASSDHISTHISYCNLWVTSPTREGVMEAFHKRRAYGSTDNILADVQCGGHFMGEEFTTSEAPAISVKLWGTGDFAKVHIIKDGEYAYSVAPNAKNVDFVWKDAAAEKGKTSYYYVRGEQADGELVWVSPMWITYR